VQEPVFRRAATVGPPHGRCLNAGCGEGIFSEFLESFPEITEIVNIDIELPQIGARRQDPRHTDVAGSMTDLPADDASFDWALCTEVLEFIEDDAAAAREVGRVLRPGAFALVSVPTPPAPRVSIDLREGYTLQALSELLALGELEIVWHHYCFHLIMRRFVVLWQWQYKHLGGGRRSAMPRFAVLAFGYADRWLHIGRPWDLVVVVRRR
jgi:2-polyprenyl-3-methyl-5-hydroxy-6-metoxy-1,4-benzoquinol methylase